MDVHDKIAVMDFGGQYAHLIATKVRRLRVLAEILQPEDDIEKFRDFKGIIFSGSPALSAYDEDSAYDRRIFDLPIPILGFCFGHQEIAKHYGGQVEHTQREYGPALLRVAGKSPIFKGLDPEETVWMSHGDTVTVLPPGFAEVGVSLATADAPPHANAAIANDALKRYGFQFHPEVDDTVHGEAMLHNFVVGICHCRPNWTMDLFGEEEAARIREKAGDRGVFLLASGGVDSTVCAVLLGRALGPERVHLLHIDNGLMRKGESAKVLEEFEKRGLGGQPALRGRLGPVSGGPERGRGTREEAAHHRGYLHRRVPRQRRAPGPPRLPPGPGDHLPGHHRDGRHEAGGCHQDPPQPRAHHRGHDPGGTSCGAPGGALQGRGAGAGRGPRAPRIARLAPSLPGARPRHQVTLLRRGARGERGRCARPG